MLAPKLKMPDKQSAPNYEAASLLPRSPEFWGALSRVQRLGRLAGRRGCRAEKNGKRSYAGGRRPDLVG